MAANHPGSCCYKNKLKFSAELLEAKFHVKSQLMHLVNRVWYDMVQFSDDYSSPCFLPSSKHDMLLQSLLKNKHGHFEKIDDDCW